MCMLFLLITAVESQRIRVLQNSSARTCESNEGVFSNLALGLHNRVWAHFKVEEPCKTVTERYFDFYC